MNDGSWGAAFAAIATIAVALINRPRLPRSELDGTVVPVSSVQSRNNDESTKLNKIWAVAGFVGIVFICIRDQDIDDGYAMIGLIVGSIFLMLVAPHRLGYVLQILFLDYVVLALARCSVNKSTGDALFGTALLFLIDAGLLWVTSWFAKRGYRVFR